MNDSRPWWLWPNLLSVDAPIVAVVWQRFLAASLGAPVPVAASVALAGLVWAIYLIDRQLDVRSGELPSTDRHRFARANSFAVASLSVVALPVGTIAGLCLPAAYMRMGVAVAAVSLAYFALVHFTRRRAPGFKELTVGLVFAAGVAIPLAVDGGRDELGWLAPVAAFAGLCAVNCLLISRWEDVEGPPGWLPTLLAALAAAASAAAPSVIATAVLSSLALLGLVHLSRRWIAIRCRRVLADAVMLTPLLAMVAS